MQQNGPWADGVQLHKPTCGILVLESLFIAITAT